MAGRLAGKIAIVTGGASGIGEVACRIFVREMVKGLLIADVNETQGAALATALRTADSDVVFQPLDVSQEAQWVACMAMVEARWGRLDILVNNAGRGGVLTRPTVEHTTEEGMDFS
ncbi:MAG: SDR family NAD(P)-dependent oxidoreductase, partial [Armatimonadetes bacterium]|nr:SDR family NAD(P)-dependent oxidoreductase [Armatimonadota bacterium]